MRWWAIGLAVALGVAGCNSHHASPPPTTRPENVVAQRSSAFASITVSAGGRTIVVPPNLRSAVAPLLAARVFKDPDPLTTYGLDQPRARLEYRAANGEATTVLVGSPNFDRHGIYVQRQGGATVYLTPYDQLAPVLALVGIDVPPPTD